MAKAASKMSKKSGSKKGAKKGSKKTFATYIKRVLKQATKGKLGMSSKTTAVVNSFVTDMFDRIATEAAALARANKKSTIGSREIQTAVRLTLPAELAKHSMAEAVKAVAKVSK